MTDPGPPGSLPAGWRVALDPDTRRVDGGHVLIGGAPLRLLRVTDAGARLVDDLAAGAPVQSSPAAQRLVRRLLAAGLAHPRPAPGSPQPGVTVVIPVRDEPVRAAAALGDIPTIVVDDGSRDALAPPALRHERSRGPGAARNTGWRAATTPLVAFLDADCVPADGWLDRLLPHFGDPDVVAVAPRIVATGSGVLGAYEAVRSPLDRGQREGPVRPRGRVPFVPTAALVVRRSALSAAGGFDESLRVGEDVDLVWRLVAAGGVVRYVPDAEVAHPARQSWGQWLQQRWAYGGSAAPLARRHGAAVAPLAVSGWSAAAWALAGLGAPVSAAAVAAGTAALLQPRLSELEHPWEEAIRLAGAGHLHAGGQIADAVRRTWWPAAVAVAVVSKRARWAVAVCLLPLLGEWRRERPPLDPVRWTLLRVADDMAYGAGVWRGCVKERSFAALRPDLSSWPGRRRAVETPTGLGM